MNLVSPRGTSLTQTTSNRVANPSITRLFQRISLMHVLVYMAIIHMSSHSYPRCTKCGKLKQLLKVRNHLRILHHLNQKFLQILSLTKDLLLLNLSQVKQPIPPDLLVLVTTRSSWWILVRLIPPISTCKLSHVNMISHWLCPPLSPKPKHLLSLLHHQMVRYRSINLNFRQFLRSQRDHYAVMWLLT